MSELYDKIVSERGSFEKMVASIPGFKGYQDKQERRKADTMLREFAAGKIQQLVDKLVQTEKLILDNIGMSYMSRTRDLKGRIQLYHDKVSTAAPKYSGMGSDGVAVDADPGMLSPTAQRWLNWKSGPTIKIVRG